MMFSAFTSLLQIFFENETAGLFLWGSGTLVQNNWEGVQFALPFVLCGLLATLSIAKSLDIFLLGEEVATGLGQKTNRLRIITVMLAVFFNCCHGKRSWPYWLCWNHSPTFNQAIRLSKTSFHSACFLFMGSKCAVRCRRIGKNNRSKLF